METSAQFTILNVDDYEAARYARCRILRQAGFETQEAGSGTEALKMITSVKPNLVLLDVNLPDMNGFEVCRRIKSDPETASIPVMHLSASVLDSKNRARGLECGADAYLTEPIDPELLVASVRATLRIRHAEDAVRAAAVQWQTTFDAIRDGLAVTDANGRVRQCNQALGRLWQKSMDQIIGCGVDDLVPCPEDPAIQFAMNRLRDAQNRITVQVPFADRWFKVTTDPIVDEKGVLAGRVYILCDITEKRRADSARERLVGELEAILEQMPAGVTIAEAPSGNVIRRNRAIQEITGYSELKYRSIEDYSVVPGFREDGSPYQPHEWPLARSVERGEVVRGEEIRIVAADGTLRVARINSAPVRNRQGEILAGVAIIDDVTERRAIEVELRVRARQQAAVARFSQEALAGSDVSSLLQDAVRLVAETLTVEFAEMLELLPARREFVMRAGVGWREGLLGITVEAGSTASQAGYTVERQEPTVTRDLRSETRFQVPSFRLEHGVVSGVMVPILGREAPVGVLAADTMEARDFTPEDIHFLQLMANVLSSAIERKNAEELVRQSLREKEVLLKEIHHRVKNNLQVISSLLNLQSGYVKDPQALQMFRESRNRIRSIALIHEKLYQSRDLSMIDFGEYARNLADTLLRTYSSGGVTMRVDVEQVFLEVDIACTCGLLINELVSNSLKYAFPPPRKGEVALSLTQDKDGLLCLTVADNGVGLPEGTDVRQTETLGLQLVSALTEQLGGELELRGGGGTRFEVRFPTKRTEDSLQRS